MSVRLDLTDVEQTDHSSFALTGSEEADMIHQHLEFVSVRDPNGDRKRQLDDAGRLGLEPFGRVHHMGGRPFDRDLLGTQEVAGTLGSGPIELQGVRDFRVMGARPVGGGVQLLRVTRERHGDRGSGAAIVIVIIRVVDDVRLHDMFTFMRQEIISPGIQILTNLETVAVNVHILHMQVQSSMSVGRINLIYAELPCCDALARSQKEQRRLLSV